MKTRRLTMAQALLEFLSVQWVRRDGQENPFFAGLWGIFGHGNVAGIGQAVQQMKGRLPYHLSRNEQAQVHAAVAFAKHKNRLQTWACTSSIGPGATNMVTGAALATINRLPVLLLPGDIFAHRYPAPVLQQLECPQSLDVSVNDCFRPVSRFWDRINRPDQLPVSLLEAMRVLTSPSETGAGHEGGPGHATLHRFRPNYMRSAAPEVRAYHEAFGDVSAMLTQLKNPGVLEAVARQTGGDLSKHNVISDLGEQFGKAINDFVVAQGGPKDYTGGPFVRTAINDLKWADPETLPDRPDPKHPEQLSSEAHDFSRLWTGAVYSILGQAVKDRMAHGEDAKSAIANANEDLLKITGKLTSNTSPEGDFTFADLARAMVKADSLVGTKLGGLITAEMTRRQILPQSLGLRNDEDLALPGGSYDVDFRFSGQESAFKGTQLENLGGFSMVAPQSGQPLRGLVEDDHTEAKSKLAGDIARLARQGKVLFTTPDQNPKDISMFDKDGEPYAAQVTWVNGRAKLEPVMIMG